MRISDWSSDVCSSDLEVYNCQDLMQVAAASLLAWALSLLNSADGGLPILEIRAQVVDELTSQSELGFAGSWREFRSRNVRETYDFRETWNQRSEEHTSELQSLMRISYAVFCLKKKKTTQN